MVPLSSSSSSGGGSRSRSPSGLPLANPSLHDQPSSPSSPSTSTSRGNTNISTHNNARNNRKASFYCILLLSLLSVVWLHQDQLMIIMSGNTTLANGVSRQQMQSSQSYFSTIGQQQDQQRQEHLLPDMTFSLGMPNTTILAAAASDSLRRDSIDNHILPPHRPFCKRSQVIDGQWLPVALDKPPYITSTMHLRCYPREHYDQSPYHSYDWNVRSQAEHGSAESVRADKLYDNTDTIPDCLWTAWSANEFCKATRDQHVMIAGDSLSWEHYASLVQLLGAATHQGFQHQSKAFGVPIGQSVCDGRTKIWYLRDDKLEMLPSVLEEFVPHVLVVNRGAHYVNDTMLLGDLRNKTFPAIQQWQRQCRATHGDVSNACLFAWRTSVPGHPNCSDGKASRYTKPNNHLNKMQQLIGDLSNYDDHSIKYHWYDYQHQNELVLELLRDMFGSDGDMDAAVAAHDDLRNYMVLDAYYLNVRRPDEHRAHQGDCLHNCYPGKMDVYSRLLLHYMMAKRNDDPASSSQTLAGSSPMIVIGKNNTWFEPIDVSTKYDKQGWMDIIYGSKNKKGES